MEYLQEKILENNLLYVYILVFWWTMPMVLFYVIAPLRWLIMCLLAKYMDPTYTVSFEKGFGLKTSWPSDLC